MTYSLVDDLAIILSGKLGRKVGVHRYSIGSCWRYNLIFETAAPGLPFVIRDLNIDGAKRQLSGLIDMMHFGVIISATKDETGSKGSQQDAKGSGASQRERADLHDPSSRGYGGSEEERYRTAREIVARRDFGDIHNDAFARAYFDTAVACVVDALLWTDARCASPGPIDATA